MAKRIWLVAIISAGAMVQASAQFRADGRDEPRVADGLIHEQPSAALFGWFNPDRFHMRHSLSFSYMTVGDQGLSLGTYTNSMMYDFADNLRARADMTLSTSPFGSFPLRGRNDLGNLSLSRVQLDYRPWENVRMQFQYRKIPYGEMLSPWYNPWYREEGF